MELYTTYHWLLLPNEERILMRELLGIPRSSGTIMQDGKMQSDGCTMQDLKAINVDKLKAFVGSTSEDFESLYAETLAKMRGILAERQAAAEKVKMDEYDDANFATAKRMAASIMKSIKGLPLEAQQVIYEELGAMLDVGAPLEVKKPKKNVTK